MCSHPSTGHKIRALGFLSYLWSRKTWHMKVEIKIFAFIRKEVLLEHACVMEGREKGKERKRPHASHFCTYQLSHIRGFRKKLMINISG